MIQRLRHHRWRKIILESGLFDIKYYLFTYPDIRAADIDPIMHYIRFGLDEGRNLNDFFDLSGYIAANPDIKELADSQGLIFALLHYIQFGKKEIQNGNRALYFNHHKYFEEEYLRENPDVKNIVEQGLMTSYEHYLKFGCKEIQGRSRFCNQIYIMDETYRFKNEYLQNMIDPKDIDPKSIATLEVPKFEKPTVSIVLPAYNQAQYTHNAISSIIKSSPKDSYEIIVMDDNSPQSEAKNLNQKIKNITFVSNEINLGFLKNCNKGATYAKGKYILFLNNDTYVLDNWLDSLVELIESKSDIGMVGSKLVYPDARLQEAGGIVWNDASGWNYGRLDIPTKPEYNYVKEVDYISGASIMIKHDLWEEIGGFDERYIPAYYEDTDLAFEVRKHGKKVVYQPKSEVVHFEGISHGVNLGSNIKKYQVINNKKFYLKWKNVLNTENFPNKNEVFLARDRSRLKRHMLFVDHYLPHFDQDAGSKATFQYLRTFVQSGIKVHFIGDNFWHYPDTQYLDALTSIGIEVLYGQWYKKNLTEWLYENSKYFDYIILSRPHIAVKYIDIVREASSNAYIIYFGHDLHFLRERREYEVKKNKHYLISSQHWKQQELNMIEKSDIAYFFSNIEKSVIEQINQNLKVDIVPLYIYENFIQSEYHFSRREGIMFVGGFGHGPNVDAMKWFVHEVWPLIMKRIGKVNFYIIGSNPPKEILNLKNETIKVTGFVCDEELNEYYNNCRLVIAPLRFGAGVKGKIIDALYHGMPIVTTSIGAEGLQEAQDCLCIANDEQTFADEVCRLYLDEKALKGLAKNGLDYCKKYFSYDYAKKAMSKIIKEFQ